jgi:tRNA A-37 threonylcarbamoyl transferase component Bud32
MDSAAEVDRCLQSFFAGRLPFDKLVIALKSLRAEGDPHGAVSERLQYWVDLGRLPADLKGLLASELGPSAQAAASALLDQPTVPLSGPPPSMAAPQPPAIALPAASSMRDKVDEVIVDALIGGFTGLRGRGRDKAPREDAALDANLADFRSLRYRRDASNAEAGRARRFELDPRQEARTIGTGAMLKDRFILDSEIGRGGMGVVYRAVDRRRLEAMHRQPYVAVKLLSGDFRQHPDALRTLEAEARKAQELAHPNIVTVHDFERDGQHLFIVMELLEGDPLDSLLGKTPGKPLAPATADAIIRSLCAGLGHAHERGVVHADLKPANIFVGARHEVKLLDFGIASATRAGGFDPASLGGLTLPYASPGMIEGAGREPRDDVYGLGCVVHMLLSGHHPFAMAPAVEAREQGLAPQRPGGLSDQAWGVLCAALAFDPSQRPADAVAFQRAFYADPPFVV